MFKRKIQINILWAFAFFLFNFSGFGQCVVINEIMVNANGGATPPNCDGGCAPNTGEWIELYNTCNVPVDISCYVFTDGDWTATIPSGTTIPANGYYVIGSINSNGGNTAGLVDLFLGSCNCTSGAQEGVFTNNNEQAILVDAAGSISDAVYWGGGQFPVSINSSNTVAGCGSVLISVPNSTAATQLPSGGGDGCSLARICDGASVFEERCGSSVSIRSSNGIPPQIDISASSTSICLGECIDFSNNNTGVTAWNWTFENAQTTNSNIGLPTGICYNSPGSFDVTLTITNACGTFTETFTDYITVNAQPIVTITASDNDICPGDCINFSFNSNVSLSNLNWNFNGAVPAFSSATLPTNICYNNIGQFDVTLDYNSACGTGQVAEPNFINVNSFPIPNVDVFPSNILCNGGTVSLSLSQVYNSYQWLQNGNPITGQVNQTITVTTPGNYSVIVSNSSGCTIQSVVTTISNSNVTPPVLSSSAQSICMGNAVTLTATSGFTSYDWFLSGNLIATTTQNTLNINLPGDYVVSAIHPNGCTLQSATIQIGAGTLNVNINANGPLSFCQGNSVLLNANIANANYQWYLNGNPIAGATQQSIIAQNTGVYSVDIEQQGCTGTSNVSINVFTSTPVSIVSSEPSNVLCDGSQMTLTTNATGAIQWLFNNQPIAGATGNTITVSNFGNYLVQETDFNGCINIASLFVNIAEQPLPQITQGNFLAACENNIPQLSLTQNYQNIQWYLDGVAIPGATSSSFLPVLSGNYDVIVSNPNSCTGQSQQTQLVINPNPAINLLGPLNYDICPGSSITVNTSGDAGQFSLLLNGQIQQIGSASSFQITDQGNYTIMVTDANNCSAETQTFSVVILPLESIVVSSENGAFGFCPGSNINLSVNASTNAFNWYLNNVIIPGTQNQSNITVNSQGWVKVVYQNTNGCNSIDSVFVSEFITPQAVLSADINDVCVGGQKANLTIQPPALSYDWYFNNTLFLQSNASLYQTDEPGNYFVTVLFSNGCSSTSNIISLTNSPFPQFSIMAVPSANECIGKDIELKIIATEFYNYLWDDGSNSAQRFVFESGNFSVSATTLRGCKSSASTSVNFKPLPTVDAGQEGISTCLTPYVLNANTEGIFSWSPQALLENPNELTTATKIKNDTWFVLTANLDGCQNSDSVFIRFQNCSSAYIPNSFSPNSDNINDLFKVFIEDADEIDLKIYNRWGEMIFQTNNINEGWDGKHKGLDCPSGLYVWTLSASKNGAEVIDEQNAKGIVHLLR